MAIVLGQPAIAGSVFNRSVQGFDSRAVPLVRGQLYQTPGDSHLFVTASSYEIGIYEKDAVEPVLASTLHAAYAIDRRALPHWKDHIKGDLCFTRDEPFDNEAAAGIFTLLGRAQRAVQHYNDETLRTMNEKARRLFGETSMESSLEWRSKDLSPLYRSLEVGLASPSPQSAQPRLHQ